MPRTLFMTGLLLLSGLFSLMTAAPAAAGSTTIEITDVFNATTVADEYFQLYNATKDRVSLSGYAICTSGQPCIRLPAMSIEPYSLAKIKASTLADWPKTGLDGTNDMLGLLNPDGKTPVDSVNWGTPNTAWKNYALFKDMLWNPGVKAPDPSANQSFFRVQISNDTDKPSDWLATATTAAQPTAVATAKPGTTPAATPAATKTPTAPVQANTNPKTGGEFPFLVTVALVLAVLGVRYFRLRRSPSNR
jgi:hypothetical protein